MTLVSVNLRRFSAVLAILALVGADAPPLRAQEAVGWELTGLHEPVIQLFTPPSGAFFAQTAGGLLRSDDAGATWVPISLPAGTSSVAIDGSTPPALYAGGEGGLSRSTDGGASWTSLLADKVVKVTVSPADPKLLYLALVPSGIETAALPQPGGPGAQYLYGPSLNATHRFVRSRDGGQSWEKLSQAKPNYYCTAGFSLLQPHPSDPQRVYRSADCYGNWTFADALERSTDQGAAWAERLVPLAGFPDRLAGGSAANPERLYLSANHEQRVGGASLFRSDDGGGEWVEVAWLTGGGNVARQDLPRRLLEAIEAEHREARRG
jgi:photosystem II stability/assembly factor-like uncharacterized protein